MWGNSREILLSIGLVSCPFDPDCPLRDSVAVASHFCTFWGLLGLFAQRASPFSRFALVLPKSCSDLVRLAAASGTTASALADFKCNGKTKAEGPILCPGNIRGILDLQFSRVTPDGFFLINGCQDSKAMLRDGVTGDWMGTFVGHKGSVYCARLNEPATRAITASSEWNCKLWDALTGDNLHTITHKHVVRTSVFSKDGQSVITGGQEKKLRIWDLNKLDSEPSELLGHAGTITHAIAAPDGTSIFSAGSDEKNVKVWDIRTLKVVRELPTSDKVVALELSQDDSTLTCATAKEVSFFDSKSLSATTVHKLNREVTCVTYHPRAKHFVVGSGMDVVVYDIGGKEVAINKGHHGGVRCLAFSPHGESFASGAEDATVRIWEFEGTGASIGEERKEEKKS